LLTAPRVPPERLALPSAPSCLFRTHSADTVVVECTGKDSDIHDSFPPHPTCFPFSWTRPAALFHPQTKRPYEPFFLPYPPRDRPGDGFFSFGIATFSVNIPLFSDPAYHSKGRDGRVNFKATDQSLYTFLFPRRSPLPP